MKNARANESVSDQFLSKPQACQPTLLNQGFINFILLNEINFI